MQMADCKDSNPSNERDIFAYRSEVEGLEQPVSSLAGPIQESKLPRRL